MITTNRTFGIEIEAIGITMNAAAAAISAAGIPCRVAAWGHTTARDWRIVTDGSVSHGFEVVSPILSGKPGLEAAVKVAAALVAAGARVDHSCGLHVHVGISDVKVRAFKSMVKNYIKFEDFFDHIMPNSRRANNNSYIQSNRARFGGYDNAAVNTAFDKIDAARNIDSVIAAAQGTARYFKLNFQAYHRQGTVEFRQHSGTVDPAKIENWIKLLLSFVEGSIVGAPRKRTKDAPLTEAFARFFDMFKIAPEVRKFYHARRKALLVAPTTRD